MKILHINSYYSGSNFYKNLYDKQMKLGLDIDVYVPVSTAIDIEKLQLGDYTTLSVNHQKYDRFIFHLKHYKIYKDIIRRFNFNEYSILHAHSLFSNGYIAYKLKQKYSIPYIVAVRNTDVNTFFKKMVHLRKLGVNILLNAEKIVFISEPYKSDTINNYIPKKHKEDIERKSIVIPNGVDDFWYKNKYCRNSMPTKGEIKLIYVGNIDSNKNIDTTIKACEILLREGYKVEYKIIGKITNDKYNEIINKHDFIKYVTYSPKEELIKHYRVSDIFIMPSKHETFGIVYAEAMSQGLPVIYTRGQGFDGQFEEGEVGYSVQYNSAEEISTRVRNIMDRYEMISIKCIDNLDKFNWDKIAREYIKIYRM